MKKFNKIRFAFYEGEPTPEPTPSPAPNPNPAPNPAPAPNPNQTFTQEQVARMVSEERRKLTEKNRQTITQLEQLQTNANLTQQERDGLAQQIETLKAEYQTKEQQQQGELQKLQQKYERDTKKIQDEASSWKGRFEEKHVSTDIYEASAKYKAFSPAQIYAILRPLTKAVEDVGDDQKPNGKFTSKVDFIGLDKDKKPVALKLSVDDAVKMMTEMPEQYGNLFRNEANPGLGLHSNNSNGDELDIDKMSPEEYERNQAKIHERMSK